MAGGTKEKKPDTPEMLRRAIPQRVRDELSKRAKAIRDRRSSRS